MKERVLAWLEPRQRIIEDNPLLQIATYIAPALMAYLGGKLARAKKPGPGGVVRALLGGIVGFGIGLVAPYLAAGALASRKDPAKGSADGMDEGVGKAAAAGRDASGDHVGDSETTPVYEESAEPSQTRTSTRETLEDAVEAGRRAYREAVGLDSPTPIDRQKQTA